MTLDHLKDLANRALRSGKYKQTGGRLKDPDTGCYCALGAIASEAAKTDYKRIVEGDYGFFFHGLEDSMTSPAALRQASVPPAFIDSLTADCISTMNDCGQTFEQIADYIDSLASLPGGNQ